MAALRPMTSGPSVKPPTRAVRRLRSRTRMQSQALIDRSGKAGGLSLKHVSLAFPLAIVAFLSVIAAALWSVNSSFGNVRSEEHTSELQSPCNLVCRLLLEKKK